MANIYQRLAAAMRKVEYVQKEKKSGMRYSIVSHDAVTAKVRPALLDAGVVYHPHAMTVGQTGNRTEVTMTVRFVNIDEPDQFIDVPSAGYGIDDQDKGIGKAISYAGKYALLKALGLETGDDPDMDQDVTYTDSPEPPPRPRTSNEVKKNSPDLWPTLEKDVRNATTRDELTAVWQKHKDALRTLPVSWREQADELFQSRVADFAGYQDAAE